MSDKLDKLNLHGKKVVLISLSKELSAVLKIISLDFDTSLKRAKSA